MSVDHLKPEYPEHLNPFRRKRTNTLTRSFRDIKNAIIKSFTGKDREKPTLRPKQGNELATNRAVFSLPPPPVSTAHSPVALPRSRFSERLSKTDAIRASTLNKKSITNVGHNPFDDGEERRELKNGQIGAESLVAPAKPARLKHKKRKKKAAPVPPGSVSGSKWSLDSGESDISSIGFYSEADIDFIDKTLDDNDEEILNLTREIAKFTEDTNNNSIHNSTRVQNGDEVDEERKEETGESSEKRKEKVIEERKEEVMEEQNEEVIEERKEKVIEERKEELIEERKEEVIEERKEEVIDGRKEEVIEEKKEERKEEVIDEKKEENREETSRLIKEERNDNCENKSSDDTITITDENRNAQEIKLSTNETNHVLFVSSVDKIECRDNATPSPIPKIRKNILTKENLLGSEN